MVGVIPLSNPFPCTVNPTVKNHHRRLTVSLRVANDEAGDKSEETTSSSPQSDFDRRLAEIQERSRSGRKKAERRKAKKAAMNSSSPNSGNKKTVMLPPVPLLTPISINGVPVELGFTPYSEKLNGFLAGLGLAALLLVELGSGKSVMAYHTPSIVFIQIYTVASLAALFVKYEREKISVWPKTRTNSGTEN